MLCTVQRTRPLGCSRDVLRSHMHLQTGQFAYSRVHDPDASGFLRPP